MKETKVYVDELPAQCLDCRFAYDGRCQAKENGESYCVENCRRSDCPLHSLKAHDRELVKEVCEKIRIKVDNISMHTATKERLMLMFEKIKKELEGEDE